MIRSYANDFLKELVSLNVATTITTTASNGNSIDTQGALRMRLAVISGTITDGSYTAKIQESDDESSWSDVDDSQVLGTKTFAATDDNTIRNLDVLSTKKYIRLVITPSGATTGGVFSAIAIIDPKLKS